VTDDDGTVESGHPPDPGPGLGSVPDQSPPIPPGSATPPVGPGQAGPPAPQGQRASRHLHPPQPSFGVAHPAAPGPASAPAHSPAASPAGPATPPVPDPLSGHAAGGPTVPVPAPAPPASPAARPGTTAPPDGTTAPLDIDQIASQVYERIGDKMDHRPDTAQDTPPAEQAIMLRDKAPELYDLWLKIAQEKAATSNYVQRAPYEVPERLAQSGRPRALSAMIVVLAFCGYLASLGGPGPYIGGLIAILDLLVMLALFFGLRPDHLTDSSRPRKRRLIQAA
jgi:hypothetical protein